MGGWVGGYCLLDNQNITCIVVGDGESEIARVCCGGACVCESEIKLLYKHQKFFHYNVLPGQGRECVTDPRHVG